ncbi:Crp/Fnr family transcriptional regulator [uncultured Ilyobacter sp.]|uniref:Crp/Fnr family transcriptional regulator n=1 Tax=uncultured Ilyobacter sp. TaxID=544433 RepID=UPI002AA6568F|nr:Crp/Fnr family transcriptional regulator [uncultured Ilyobacter sp.]
MLEEYLELFDIKDFNETRKYFSENFYNFGKEKNYKKDDFIIFNSGEEIILFQHGELDIGIEDMSGKERLLYKFKYNGTVIGDIEMFSSKKRAYIIKFIKNTKLRFISKGEIERFLNENPIGYKYFLKSVIRDYNISMTYLKHNSFYSTEEKIVEFLLRIATVQEPDKKNNVVIENYTHESIGSFINISRYLVSKTLKNLENLDLIDIKFKKILLLDIDKLDSYRENIRK